MKSLLRADIVQPSMATRNILLYEALTEEANKMMEDCDFLFHHINVEKHEDGDDIVIQIHISKKLDAQQIYENLSLEEDSLSGQPIYTFKDKDGNNVIGGETSSYLINNWIAQIVQSEDESGNVLTTLVKDRDAIDTLINQENALAFHFLAELSRSFDLAPVLINGDTATLSHDEKKNERIVSLLLIDEALLEYYLPEPTHSMPSAYIASPSM